MVETKKVPKRGGARRGPYSGKKMTFTTKLTEPTMMRLTAAAKASEMSVSQKGEAAIVRGLDAEDDFHLHFAPSLASFERQMILSMPPRDGSADMKAWTARANSLVQSLSDQLRRAILAVPSSLHTTARSQAPSAVSTPEPSPSRRTGRRLDLD